MFHPAYDEMVRFASQGDFVDELLRAKAEYIARTGELFETDDSFEQRIGAFLEWYVLDRAVSFAAHRTPAKLYIDSVAPNLPTPDLMRLRLLTKTVLSLFEFRRFKGDVMLVEDLLRGVRLEVPEQRRPPGLESGDVFEARLVPVDQRFTFSDALAVHPHDGRRAIARGAKRFRKSGSTDAADRIAMVQKVAYYANRCQRYRHVPPQQIFAELVASAA